MSDVCSICHEDAPLHDDSCPATQRYAWATVSGGIVIRSYASEATAVFSAVEIPFLVDQITRAVPLAKRQQELYDGICDSYEQSRTELGAP